MDRTWEFFQTGWCDRFHVGVELQQSESEDLLCLLDVMVTRLPEAPFGHSVYRKPTHTDRYFHATSHHHPAQKRSVIDSLIHRTITITGQTPERKSPHISSTKMIRPPHYQFSHSTWLNDRLVKILERQKVKTVFKPATKFFLPSKILAKL